jgi:hypothetical protein
MAANDDMLQDELNREWDALVLGRSGAGRRLGLAALVVELERRDDSAAPDPAFAGRLWRELQLRAQLQELATRPQRSAGAGTPQCRSGPNTWPVYGFGLAAAAILLALAATIYVEVFRAPEASMPSVQVGAVDDSPNATPSIESVATELVQGTATTPAVGVPSPSAQLGGDIPIYDELSQVVNAAELIVVAAIGEELPPLESGVQMHVLEIERVVRGAAPEQAYLAQGSDLEAGVSYVLALNPFTPGPETTYTPLISLSPLKIEAGLIAETEFTPYRPLEARYAGQQIDTLIADIAAIPDIEPAVEALLAEWGWAALGKQALWPLTLPAEGEFATAQPLRYMPYSWEQLLAVSTRVDLNFRDLAGEDVQLLVYGVERAPDAVGTRPIWAGFLIVEQQIVGAWAVVAGVEQPFALSERDEALAVPAMFPTPAPTPTMPVPSGDTVNPTQLYDLVRFANLHLCWPYCDAEPRSAELRDVIVTALDRELELRDVSVQPTPTQDYSLQPARGEYIQLVFGAFEPGVRHIAFGYDRVTGLLLLPDGAGWVVAPPELATAVEGLELPLPPTKPGT